jgi:hypothetical protein
MFSMAGISHLAYSDKGSGVRALEKIALRKFSWLV